MMTRRKTMMRKTMKKRAKKKRKTMMTSRLKIVFYAKFFGSRCCTLYLFLRRVSVGGLEINK